MAIPVIGDVHLEKLNTLLPAEADPVGLQLKAMEQVFDWALDHDAHDVVQAGDLFDNHSPDQDTISRLGELLRKKDIVMHVIMGNHDKLNADIHSMRILNWLGSSDLIRVKVYTTPQLIKLDGVRCWMCPHPFIEKAPKKVQWNFGHFPWKGAKRENGTIEKHGSNPKGMWVLGDFHTHQFMKNGVYAGSLTQLSWEEDENKGFLILDEGKVDFQRISLPYIRRIASVSSDKQLKALDKDVYWKVVTPPDYSLPPDWARKYPHILRYDPYSTSKKKDSKVSVDIRLSEDMFEGIEDDLKTNLNPWEASYATKWINKQRAF